MATTLGQRLRAARLRAGLTQKELGERIDRSDATIRQYESDSLQLWRHKDVLENIAKVLGIDVRELTDDQTIIGIKPTVLRRIPLFTDITAGLPSSQTGDVDSIEVKDWGTSKQRWARIVRGESMSPMLQTGDIAIFEEGQAESGMVVHAFHNGEDWRVKGFLVMVIRDIGGGTKQTLENKWGLRP